MSADPLNATPFIFLAVSNVVAVVALPLTCPLKTDVEETVIPFLRLVNPATASNELISKSLSANIATTVSLRVAFIIGQ